MKTPLLHASINRLRRGPRKADLSSLRILIDQNDTLIIVFRTTFCTLRGIPLVALLVWLSCILKIEYTCSRESRGEV